LKLCWVSSILKSQIVLEITNSYWTIPLVLAALAIKQSLDSLHFQVPFYYPKMPLEAGAPKIFAFYPPYYNLLKISNVHIIFSSKVLSATTI
jgi:hypothetical protein